MTSYETPKKNQDSQHKLKFQKDMEHIRKEKKTKLNELERKYADKITALENTRKNAQKEKEE